MSGIGQVDVQVMFLKRLSNHGKITIFEQCGVYQKYRPALANTSKVDPFGDSNVLKDRQYHFLW